MMQWWAAITALSIWASFAVQPLLAEEGCPFLSNAEVEKITGRKLLFEFRSMPLHDGPGTLCDSDIVRVVVLLGQNSESRFDDMMQGVGREREARLPISGLGDKAYAVHLDPRKENEYPTALVVVLAKPYTAAVSVRAKEGEPAKSVQAQATELAKTVTSKGPLSP